MRGINILCANSKKIIQLKQSPKVWATVSTRSSSTYVFIAIKWIIVVHQTNR